MIYRRSQLLRRSLGLIVFVVTADLGWSLAFGGDSGVLYAGLDLPLHLLTVAALLLAIVAWRERPVPRDFAVAALVASVALDLDHVPGYLGSQLIIGSGPRPYSHSVATIAVLLAAAAALHGRPRAVGLGAAFGVGGHLLRDLATGPGVPLVWPLSTAAVSLPYVVLVAALLGTIAAVAASGAPRPVSATGRRRPSGTRIVKPMES